MDERGFGKVARAARRFVRRQVDRSLIRLRPQELKPLVLLYHRIADEPTDPWGLAVSPANFKQHLDVLQRTRVPMSLADFALHLEDGTLPKNAVAITFDDGYVDNLIEGKPLLAAADVPATVFLATGFIGAERGFWWDELARLILLTTPSANFELSIRGETLRLDLKSTNAEHGNRWRAWLNPPRTLRQEAYLSIHSALRGLEAREREAVINELRGAVRASSSQDGVGRPMTLEEIRTLIADRLVGIGAHTVTHPALTELEPMDCRREIANSKYVCETLAGGEIKMFAYPFGIFDDDVRALVAEEGFTCGCSTVRQWASDGCDPLTLPRIQALDLDGDAFERSLRYAVVGH